MFGPRHKDRLPIQLYQIDTNLNCQIALPDQTLLALIHYYWALSIPDGEHRLEVIPDNSVDLVLSPQQPGFSAVYCPAPERFQIALHGPMTYIGICMPSASVGKVLQYEISQLRELRPGADTTHQLHTTDLITAISSLRTLPEIVPHLETHLAQRLRCHTQLQSLAESLDVGLYLHSMESAIGESGIADVAAELGISERHFRREMSHQFGYSPKKVQRVMRLQAALRELISLHRAGAEDGYYDDSHRIREIRALTGMTPGQIRQLAEIYNSSV